MNQIIYTPNLDPNAVLTPNENNFQKKFFKTLFFVFSLGLICLCFYYAYFRYDLYISERKSKKLINDFEITSLYSKNSDYSADLVNYEFPDIADYSANIIGILEIKKLDITYPILSSINKDFLKISPCRFYGPNPNEIGNLCIAAHNYKNGTFFSNLSNLKNGDILTIYDNTGNALDYIVYQVYTSSANDLDCTNQNTHNKKVVTLITCDSVDNKYRTIVKAKEF